MWRWNGMFRRQYSRLSPPPPARVIRVSNNVASLDSVPKEGPKPRQLMSLPPFPPHPLPASSSSSSSSWVTAISWVKHYFRGVNNSIIQSLFTKGLVSRRSIYLRFQLESLRCDLKYVFDLWNQFTSLCCRFRWNARAQTNHLNGRRERLRPWERYWFLRWR